jgi:tRNA(Ile)-lysidine synthase TilS/MesJ
MDRLIEVEKSIIKRHRKYVWAPFVSAIKEYKLIKENDKIAVCIDGGVQSFLLCKCMQEIKKHGRMVFELFFIAVGNFTEKEIALIKENCEILNIKVSFIENNNAENFEIIYKIVKKNNCNKIASIGNFEEITEDIFYNLLEKGKIKTILPKEKINNFEIEIIRPMFMTKTKGISLFEKSCGLEFLLSKKNVESERLKIRQLIEDIKNEDELLDINIFKSVHNVNIDTVISYIKDEKTVLFLDNYENSSEKD